MRDRELESDLAFAAAAACFAAVLLAGAHCFGDGLGASDPWRHIAWARLLRETSPGALREWPVFTTFARDRVDLWALYHRLLIPFTFGDLERGARAAAVVYGGLSLGALAFVLRRLNRGAAFTVYVGTLALVPGLLLRALQARPATLGIALLELSALAVLADAPWAAFACAWAHAALHITFVLQFGLIVAAALAYGFAPRARRAAAAIGAGTVCGIFLRPRPLAFLHATFVQGLGPFHLSATGFTDLGSELYPPTLALALCAVPIVGAVLWSASRLKRPGARSTPDRTFLVIAAALFCAASLAARKFLDAAGGFAALGVCASLPAHPFARRSWVNAGLAAALCAQLVVATRLLPRPYGSAALSGAAAALRANVRPGAIVFNDDWRSWAKLFYHDPTHRYVVGCDPSLLFDFDQRKFWLWEHLSKDGRACGVRDLASCPPSGTDEIASALGEFGAEAVVLARLGDYSSLKKALDAAPDRFRPLDVGADAERGVAAYLIVPVSGGSAARP